MLPWQSRWDSALSCLPLVLVEGSVAMAEQVGFSSELPLVLVEGNVAMAEQVGFSSELPLV